jgi:hypothetical protein
MSTEPSDRRRHLARLRELIRTVASARQRRMLRDAIEHVRRQKN